MSVLKGLQYFAGRVVRRSILGPMKLRWYNARKEPFVHHSRFGLTFELEPNQFIDRYILIDGLYEDRFLEFVANQLSSDAVILDIGANIGNHALYLAGKCSVVHAFEPNPAALKRLHRHIALNNIRNIVVHPFAMGERDETATFYEPEGNLGAGSFVEHSGRKIELPIRKADDVVDELGLSRIDFIKIDVEGMEENVFRGLAKTIAQFRPLIDFEFLGQRHDPEHFARILSLLPGYNIVEVRFSPSDAGLVNRAWWNIRKAGTPELMPVGIPEPRWYENLLAIPEG
jgi:FkbM family methyltransferase